MIDVLAATRTELTKILTLPSAWIVTGIILALHGLIQLQASGLFSEAVAEITPDGVIEVFIGQPRAATDEILGLLVSSSLQAGLFLPMLAAVIAGQEFRWKQLGPTLLAVPRRGLMTAAKLLATALYVLALAIVVSAISTGFMYLAVRDWNPGLLVSAEAFAGHARFLAFAVLSSLTWLAITLIARSTLTGIMIAVGLVAITMTQLLAASAPDVDALLPFSAARNLLFDPGINNLTAGPGHGLLVLTGWAVATATAAGIVLSRRDAR